MFTRNLFLTFGVVITTSVFATPNYIVNQDNKKVIDAPHFYEFNSSSNENPNQFWWCGHTALKSALASFGINKTLQEIHHDFIYKEAHTSKFYDYNSTIVNVCDTGWCVDINLILAMVNSSNRGYSSVSGEDIRSYSQSAYYQDVKNAIDNGKVIISLSRNLYKGPNNWANDAHFFTIHGYRNEDGQKYLYIRDPYQQYGGQYTDWHEIPLSELWNHMKIGGQIHSITVHNG